MMIAITKSRTSWVPNVMTPPDPTPPPSPGPPPVKPKIDARFTGFYWMRKASDPKLLSIQRFIWAWQRMGADPKVEQLVLSDIQDVLDGKWRP